MKIFMVVIATGYNNLIRDDEKRVAQRMSIPRIIENSVNKVKVHMFLHTTEVEIYYSITIKKRQNTTQFSKGGYLRHPI